MESGWYPSHSDPDSEAEINNPSLDEEFSSASVQEVEEPLLSGIRSVMPDVTSAVTSLLVEILLSIPSSILHLWNSKAFSVGKSHVFHVAELVVSQSTSCKKVLIGDIYLPLTSINY